MLAGIPSKVADYWCGPGVVPNPIELGARAGPVYGEAIERPCVRTLPHFPTLLFPRFSSMAWCVFVFHVFLCTCLQCRAPSRFLWLRRTSRVPIGCVGRLFFRVWSRVVDRVLCLFPSVRFGPSNPVSFPSTRHRLGWTFPFSYDRLQSRGTDVALNLTRGTGVRSCKTRVHLGTLVPLFGRMSPWSSCSTT